MCEHCEARVQKALESVDGVLCATVSHAEGTAVVRTDGSASADRMKQAVEEQDYSVIRISE